MKCCCKHRKSLVSKSRKSKPILCVVSELNGLPVSDTLSDAPAQSDLLNTFAGLCSVLVLQLVDRIDKKLEEFLTSWPNDMAKLTSRLEGMLTDNLRVMNVCPVLSPSLPEDVNIDDTDFYYISALCPVCVNLPSQGQTG